MQVAVWVTDELVPMKPATSGSQSLSLSTSQTFFCFTHSIHLHAALRERHKHDPHCTDEETEAKTADTHGPK